MEKQIPYCPLLLGSSGPSGKVHCLQNECAWFIKHESPKNEECAIKALADLVKYMTMRMKI